MDHTNCANCYAPIITGDTFCGRCGQKNNFHRFTVAHITHEFFHAFTHADAGVFVLIKQLALKPGIVAHEYVSGKIKKYFNPFTFLLLCVGFFVLVNNLVKTYPEPPGPDPKVIAMIPTEAGKKNYINLIERTASASKNMNKHSNIITVIAIPIYAFITWLFFRNRGRNFAEIMLAMILFTAFATLVSTVIFNPLLAISKGSAVYFYIFLLIALIQSFYYSWGLKQFFGYRSPSAIFKIWPVMILVTVVWIIISMTTFMVYIYGSNTGKVISALWVKYA